MERQLVSEEELLETHSKDMYIYFKNLTTYDQ